ncbi:MAG: hypothetical protein J0H57_23860 [Rhodospirillales bacterium]|nr:hypothetical protein [Rhodospirillales bacterium]
MSAPAASPPSAPVRVPVGTTAGAAVREAGLPTSGPSAVVVVREGHVLTEDAVIGHCAGALARFKLPHSVVFTDALPRNATGKVHKPTLRSVFGT